MPSGRSVSKRLDATTGRPEAAERVGARSPARFHQMINPRRPAEPCVLKRRRGAGKCASPNEPSQRSAFHHLINFDSGKVRMAKRRSPTNPVVRFAPTTCRSGSDPRYLLPHKTIAVPARTLPKIEPETLYTQHDKKEAL
jgi:hypothetical protein